MDVSDLDILRIRQVVLQLVRTLDHRSAVALPRFHRRNGRNKAKPFYFAMSPGSYHALLTVEKKYHRALRYGPERPCYRKAKRIYAIAIIRRAHFPSTVERFCGGGPRFSFGA